ncbi:hypothetical protein J7F03_12990 [Streptomyces sp. ISL-43]|uniref:hypothetical protein n=1 Tax=Streptomyces sp. ISL-43 TaxID=2819183 RepID=UPI001BE9385F|nr:hypothetical protein [Streptomyces sp. ISL-43]MBT2447978.1 hypothetical protein [Streptomyces sp. ISL-43]
MTESEIHIRDRARAHVRAELLAPQGTDDPSAVDALLALAEDLFVPLAVDVELACCDAESGYPLDEPRPRAPYQQLRLGPLPETLAVREVWTDTRVTRVEDRDRLARAEILGWLAAVRAGQECAQPRTATGWTQLLVESVRARLPKSTGELSVLPVSYGAGVIAYPVERPADASDDSLWVSGPLEGRPGTAPFELRIVNEAGFLSLDLSLNWSPWIEPDGAGRPAVDAAVARLSSLGWDVTSAA